MAPDQVESLGARFVETGVESETQQDTGGYARELEADAQARQHQVLAEHVKDSDMVITTAQIPNRKAPVLITADMVASMRTGSVIVDLAAPGGGNPRPRRALWRSGAGHWASRPLHL